MQYASPIHDLRQNAILSALDIDPSIAMQTRRYRTGETFDLGAGLDFIVSGLVSLRVRSQGGRLEEVALLGGEALLDRAYLGTVLPGLTCTAVTQCVIASLDRTQFSGAVSARLEVMERQFYTYLVAAMAGTISTAYCRTKPRILRWIGMASGRLGSSDIFTSQAVLADCLGLARPRLNIALQSLQAQGCLDLGRGRISLLQTPRTSDDGEVPAGVVPPCYRLADHQTGR